MPKNSPPTRVTCKGVAFVSGPRTVMVASPWYLDTTISHWLAATERKSPVRSLCALQILSTKGESDSLSSKVKIMVLPPTPAVPLGHLPPMGGGWEEVNRQFRKGCGPSSNHLNYGNQP